MDPSTSTLSHGSPFGRIQAFGRLSWAFPGKRIGEKKFGNFLHQVENLIHSGLSLPRAFEILAENSEYPEAFLEDLRAVTGHLEGGTRLSEALKAAPRSFPLLFCLLIQVAEKTGNFEFIFRQASEIYLEKARRRDKILSILMYPMIVLGLCVAVLLLLSQYVIPKLSFLTGDDLPFLTRLMIGSLNAFPIAAGALLATGILGARYLRRRRETDADFAIRMDRKKLKIPLTGKLSFFEANRMTASILEILSRSGLSLPQALEIASKTQTNQYVRATLDRAQERLFFGERFSLVVQDEAFFDPVWESLMRTSEYTGDFEGAFHTLEAWYRDLVEIRTEKLSRLLEPAMTALIGVFVGITALSLLLPIYQSYESMASLI